ncbi:protein translocase subunit SecF [bacterium]|nr:MAG: protein translocase subunit SecF [bacterium]
MQFFDKTSIDFVAKRKLLMTLSIGTIVVGLIVALIFPIKFGIDFTGGTEVGVKFKTPVKTEQVRDAVTKAGFEGAEIKSFGSPSSFLIRIKDSDNAPEVLKNALISSFPDNPHETLKVDKIGPKIGNEMRGQALLAIILAVIAITFYIAFRFEFSFGIAAIVALFHDVMFTFLVLVIFQQFGIFNLEVDQNVLAAMLTVVGYSINDTVIIFDRVRENRELMKGKSLVTIFNRSINETLSRTINTSFTTEIVLIVLLFFGGPTLEGFAFTMFVGFLVGTYSSIFIATPFALWYFGRFKKIDVGENETMKTATA